MTRAADRMERSMEKLFQMQECQSSQNIKAGTGARENVV